MNRPLTMDLSLGFATSNEWEGQQRVVLRVDDRESLEQLVEVMLTPEQFTAFLSSRFITAQGTSTAHPKRLGLSRHSAQYDLPGLPYKPTREQQEAALAEVAYLPDGCEVSFRRARAGAWQAIVFWWGVLPR